MTTCTTVPGKWYSVFPTTECTIIFPAHGDIPEKTKVCPAGEFTLIHAPTHSISYSDETADITLVVM